MASKGSSDPLLLILVSLADGPKHGHAILLDIESFAGARLGPGTLYGAIGRLEGEGLIAPLPADGRRRPYRLTPAGRDVLVARLSMLDGTVRAGLARVAR
jgi:DNA-binding PadR family transcriptional regulator